MSLEAQIQADMKSALKEGRKFELETLRNVYSQIKDERIRLRPQREITDEDVLDVIQRAVKKRKEAIDLYLQGNRPELAEKEEKEISVLNTYLPEQLSDEQITEIVDAVIAKSGASSVKDLGKVMGTAMGQLKGKADGKVVQNIVRQRLTQLSE